MLPLVSYNNKKKQGRTRTEVQMACTPLTASISKGNAVFWKIDVIWVFTRWANRIYDHQKDGRRSGDDEGLASRVAS